MKRGVLLLLGAAGIVIIVLVIILVRANRGSGEPIEQTLNVWIPFDEVKVFEEISEEFLNANQRVSLKFKYIAAKDASEYEAKVVNEIANGTGPDIWMVRSDWIPKHAPKSIPAFTSDPSVDPVESYKNAVQPNLVDLNVYQDKLYGAPVSADSLAIIYNTDYFESRLRSLTKEQRKDVAGNAKTWDQLKQRAVLFSSKAGGGKLSASAIALGTSGNTYASSDVLTALLNQAGAQILSDDRESVVFNLGKVESSRTVFPAADALSFYTSFANSAMSNHSWSVNSGNPIDAFLDGKVGGIIGYYTTLQEIVSRNKDLSIAVTPMIQRDTVALENRVDYGITWSMVVSAGGSDPGLAWRYLSTFTNSELLNFYREETKRLVPLRLRSDDQVEDRLYSPSSAATVFSRQFNTVKPYTKPEWQLVDQIFQDAINQIVVLGKSPQTSADTAAERLKAFIKPDA